MMNARVFPDRLCLVKPPPQRSGNGCSRDGKVEDFLGALFDRGGWCSFETKTLRGLNLVTASDDCTAKRDEDARRARLDHIAPVPNRTKAKTRGGEAALARAEKEVRENEFG